MRRKIYSLVLLAAGLLIGVNAWANLPQRLTPPMDPKAPEGVEMPKLETPQHPTLPEKGLVKKTFNKVAKQTPRKAPMDGELFSVAIPGNDPFKTSSFSTALNLAKNYGNPIVLLQQVSGMGGDIIDAGITIDLNGFNLSLDGITIKEGFTLTLNNSQTGPNVVTINNGEDIYGDVEYSIYAGSIAKSENVTLSITGGEFTATAATALSGYLNLTDNKLVDSYNAELGACQRLVANDVQSVCKIGDDEYISLQIALDMARLAGTPTTIDVIDDVTESNELYIYDNSDVILNLNGKTITLSDETSNSFNISYSPEDGYEATLNDKLTINGGEGGKIIATGWNFYNFGTLIVNNVALENKAFSCTYNEGFAKFVNSSITTPEATDSWIYGIENESGVIEITNTNFNCSGSKGIGIYTYSTAKDQTATVTGGTINAGYPFYVDGNLSANGSSLEGTNCVYVRTGGSANLSNCTISGTYAAYVSGGELTINEGSSLTGTTAGVYMYNKYGKVYQKGGTVNNVNVSWQGYYYLQGGSVGGDIWTTYYNNYIYIQGGTIEGNVRDDDDSYKGQYNEYHFELNPIVKGSIRPKENSKVSISGGIFSQNEEIKKYVSQGYELVDQHDGTYKVQKVKEAELNGIQYDYLTEALAAAQEGDEIQLLMDIAGCNLDIYTPGITINLNGHSISDNIPWSVEMNSRRVFGIFADNVTIKNGTLVEPLYYYYSNYSAGEYGSSFGIFIQAKDVTLQNLTIEGNPDYSVCLTSKGGGEYSAHFVDGGSYINGEEGAFYIYTNSTYTIRGTYKNTNIPANEGWDYQDNGNGTYTLVTSAAKIKGKDNIYHTVAEAFADAKENDVIYLMTTIEEDITITNSVNNLTLDIGKHNIEGKLTITGNDVKVDGFGTIDDLGGNVKIMRAYTKVDPTGYLADGSTFKSVDQNLYRVYTDKVVYMDVKDKYYPTLAEALAELPDNSTPATVKILLDEQFDFLNSFYTVKKYQNVTIDLNGHKISATTGVKENSQIFLNNGTLIIDDSSADKNGIISNCAYNADIRQIPTYGSYTIFNTGTLILNNGTIENASSGTACYCVENHINWDKSNPTFIMNGGKVLQPRSDAIRTWFNRPNAYCTSTIEINGGIIESGNMNIITHYCSNGNGTADVDWKSIMKVTINGGTLKPDKGFYCNYATGADANLSDCHITINGGDIYGYLYLGMVSSGSVYGKEDLSITGGIFRKSDFMQDRKPEADKSSHFITGGTFCDFAASGYEAFQNNTQKYIADGYQAVPVSGVDETDGNDLKIGTLSNKETEHNGSWATPETWLPLNAPDAVTDVTVKNEVIVESGTAVAHGVEINGEGQIVVKNGAVLEIGAGGIKTSNHDIQPIIVEAGGTLRVGVGGVSKEAGTLNPVEIYNDGINSGAFMINPNAQVNTMPEATIHLTTNVRKDRWQHLALPIENLTEHSNDKNAGNAVYEWKNNDWNKLGGWNEIKAFKGYDFTNNYEGQGKVTYTFKGQLVGIQNQGLSLIEGVNFFGNSYTAPISLRALFDQISSDMAANTIEKTVFIYNSSNLNYAYTTQLGLQLAEMGYAELEFVTIAPLQGFWMNLQEGKSTAGTTINYAKAVWNNTEELGKSQYAPSRESSSNNNFSTIATINVTAANGAADKVMLVEGEDFSSEFENGSDASKMLSEESFNLFAATENGNQSMVATDNLEGTVLSFQASDAINYTLNFSHIHGNEYAIRDLKTGVIISIVENGAYDFVAQPNSVEKRFEVIARRMPTDNQEVVATPIAKGIYTVTGQYMGESDNWNNIPSGMYIVDGVKMVK